MNQIIATEYRATAHNIIEQAKLDFDIAKNIYSMLDGDLVNTYNTFDNNADDITKAAKYIIDHYNVSDDSIYSTAFDNNFQESRITQFIKRLASGDLGMSKISVEVTQTTIPYIFSIKTATMSAMFPVILTRAFIQFTKLYGVTCKVTRRAINLCKEDDIYFAELALQGRTKHPIPKELDIIANACKKFKFKANPWFTVDPTINYNNSSNNEFNEGTIRFRGAEWFMDAQNDVTLIGAGGLGSNIAVSLCRVLGDGTLDIYDPDVIEHKNLAGQNFGICDIGKNKAVIVAEQCNMFNPLLHVAAISNRFSERDKTYKIVITGLDNMATRALVFAKWQKNLSPNKELNSSALLIDARLSAEKWQIFCIQGDNEDAMKEYEDKWLFSDDEADSDVCSYKQTAYAAQMCASYVTNLYVNFCSNIRKPKEDPTRRFLPFMTEYNASQMILRFKDL